MKITVPLRRSRDAERLIRAGADEFYCGVVPAGWDGEGTPHARPGDGALKDFAELSEAAVTSGRYGVPVFVCVNGCYSKSNGPLVREHIRLAAQAGAAGFIVAEPELAPLVRRLAPGRKVILSCLSPCFNSNALRFYASLGVDRITLDRQMTLEEIEVFCRDAAATGIETEVFANGIVCGTMDCFCMAVHPPLPTAYGWLLEAADALSGVLPVEWAFRAINRRRMADSLPMARGLVCRKKWGIEVRSSSSGEVLWRTEAGSDGDRMTRAFCSICASYWFSMYGVTALKVMSRGSGTHEILRSVKALKDISSGIGRGEVTGADYASAGSSLMGCDGSECYHYAVRRDFGAGPRGKRPL